MGHGQTPRNVRGDDSFPREETSGTPARASVCRNSDVTDVIRKAMALCSPEKKAAGSLHFEAGGKRRRGSAGAESAQRGASAGASAKRRRRRDAGPSVTARTSRRLRCARSGPINRRQNSTSRQLGDDRGSEEKGHIIHAMNQPEP